MDYKKSKAPSNTVTHNLMDFAEPTDNIYESIVIMSNVPTKSVRRERRSEPQTERVCVEHGEPRRNLRKP